MRRQQQPIVHLGVMATGCVIDEQVRQRYLDEMNVRAFDTGFQAVIFYLLFLSQLYLRNEQILVQWLK